MRNLLFIIGIWSFVMVANAQAGETCEVMGDVEPRYGYKTDIPDIPCNFGGCSLEEMVTDSRHVILQCHRDGSASPEFCMDGQTVLLSTAQWREVCNAYEEKRLFQARRQREAEERHEIIARLLTQMKGEQQ